MNNNTLNPSTLTANLSTEALNMLKSQNDNAIAILQEALNIVKIINNHQGEYTPEQKQKQIELQAGRVIREYSLNIISAESLYQFINAAFEFVEIHAEQQFPTLGDNAETVEADYQGSPEMFDLNDCGVDDMLICQDELGTDAYEGELHFVDADTALANPSADHFLETRSYH